MRWMNVALILVLRSISSAVKQRFPTLDHVVEAGFMTPNEKKLFESVPANEFNTYWVPCTWFVYRLQEATKQGKLLNQYSLENIMREFCEFRAKCGLLWCYDWVSIPMVYTQVVTLATYLFFIFTIIGRQKLEGYNEHKRMPSNRLSLDIDLYLPIYTILQFFFYMGLLKVAEQLINPFGDDDEDFELNWLIDRHVKASFLGCDVLMNPDRIPPLVKDYYWDKQDCPIPYTEASIQFKKKTYRGSADDMKVPEDKCNMVLPGIEEEDENGHRLSLTSLLLESSNIITNIGLGDDSPSPYQQQPNGIGRDSIGGADMAYYDRSPRYLRSGPGSWRNGGGVGHNPSVSPGQGSTRDLYGDRLKSSLDSIVPSEEEDIDRRGSLPATPRGQRMTDLVAFQERKKKKGKKDKHGFTWTPFIRDEELPLPRTPQPQMLAVKPHIRPNGDITKSKNSTDFSLIRPRRNDDDIQHIATDNSAVPEAPAAVTDNKSETSFKTANSDPQDNLIPKQVSECYMKASSESVALERKSSVRKIQEQQYSILDSVKSNDQSVPPQKPNRSYNRKSKD